MEDLIWITNTVPPLWKSCSKLLGLQFRTRAHYQQKCQNIMNWALVSYLKSVLLRAPHLLSYACSITKNFWITTDWDHHINLVYVKVTRWRRRQQHGICSPYFRFVVNAQETNFELQVLALGRGSYVLTEANLVACLLGFIGVNFRNQHLW